MRNTEHPVAGRERLALIVTADAQAGAMLDRACQRAGLQPLDCSSAQEAVELARERPAAPGPEADPG